MPCSAARLESALLPGFLLSRCAAVSRSCTACMTPTDMPCSGFHSVSLHQGYAEGLATPALSLLSLFWRSSAPAPLRRPVKPDSTLYPNTTAACCQRMALCWSCTSSPSRRHICVASLAASGTSRAAGCHLTLLPCRLVSYNDHGAYLVVNGVECRHCIADHALPLRHDDVLVLPPQVGSPQVCERSERSAALDESQLHDETGWSTTLLIGVASLYLHSMNSRFTAACMPSRHAAGDSSIPPVETPTSTCNPMTDEMCWRANQITLIWPQAEGTHSA
jgi:hypothetical protein